MNTEPTISGCGTFAYHHIPPEHAELCVGMHVVYGMDPEESSSLSWQNVDLSVNVDALDIAVSELDFCYLILPKNMPTPWEMADLKKQGVDTDILTAEQIMALRVLHATHLYNDTEVDIGNALLDGFDPDGILFYAMGSFPDECVISLGGWDGDTFTPCKMES